MTLTSLEVWESFAHHLRNYVRKRIADPDAAEDVMQDIFLRVHTHLEEVRNPERVLPWLYRIARSAVVDHVRRRVPVADLAEDLPADEPPEDDAASQIASGLGHLVDVLPEPYRLAVRLSELEGWPQAQVAQHLGLSVSGAKSRVQRGRRMLHQMLNDCCAFELDRDRHIIDYRPRVNCCAEA
ncbi:MAG TPA: RNA polymerase sigma factor SigZ [Anaerolineales bacterium]|nr:RNA polymerase sigma factor SigZ [Anaerolineales bacterium]